MKAGFQSGFCADARRFGLQPAIDEMRQPVLHRIIEHEPVLEMRDALLGARQFHAMLAADGPAAHHGVRHFGVKLDRIGIARPAGMPAPERCRPRPAGSRLTADRSLRDAIDRRGPATARRWRGRVRSAGSGNSRPRPGPRRGNPPGRRDGAPASARRGRCRDRACSPSAERASQSISRLMKSTSSLALCGPPNTTAPACSAMRLRQRIAHAGTADIERNAALAELLTDAPGRRMFPGAGR